LRFLGQSELQKPETDTNTKQGFHYFEIARNFNENCFDKKREDKKTGLRSENNNSCNIYSKKIKAKN